MDWRSCSIYNVDFSFLWVKMSKRRVCSLKSSTHKHAPGHFPLKLLSALAVLRYALPYHFPGKHTHRSKLSFWESRGGCCLSRWGSGIPFNFISHWKWRMDTLAGCDLPISWAFPAVSGLAGMRWFTLLPCCLPRTHGQLPASCLPLCVLALPSRQLPGYGCQKSSFRKVK